MQPQLKIPLFLFNSISLIKLEFLSLDFAVYVRLLVATLQFYHTVTYSNGLILSVLFEYSVLVDFRLVLHSRIHLNAHIRHARQNQ